MKIDVQDNKLIIDVESKSEIFPVIMFCIDIFPPVEVLKIHDELGDIKDEG